MNKLYRLNIINALQEQILTLFSNEQSYSRELMTQRYDESYILHYQALLCGNTKCALLDSSTLEICIFVWKMYQKMDGMLLP